MGVYFHCDDTNQALIAIENEEKIDHDAQRGVYIGADATNPTLILRIRSFLRAGVELTAFTFRRHKFNVDFEPEWNNVHLGATVDRNYFQRLPSLFRGFCQLIWHRETLREADFIYARNMDLLFLGLLARYVSGSRAKLVYEVEDVQEVFFKKTLVGAVFRRLEAWALRRVDLLVPLSPGFLRGYFEPVHKYSGPAFVLENKIQLGETSEMPTPAGTVWEGSQDRWVIGWFGTLRCAKSMSLLEEIASRLGDRVEIYTRGYPTETGLDLYLEVVNRHPNWIYEDEYTIPEDLEAMYGRVHFAWCFDFLDEFGNSPLLLPCRMYQGGFYGAVPLVAAGTEMERWTNTAGIGYSFDAPYADKVIELLENLDFETYRSERAKMIERRRELFLEDGQDTRAMLDRIKDL